MSIEKNIERIAAALETIVGVLTKSTITGGDTTIGVAPVQEDKIPGLDMEEPKKPEPKTLGASLVKTTDELRNLVQKHLTAAEKKGISNDLVAFIKDKVCPKFAPKEPKLIKIPVKDVPEAAQMIYDWACERCVLVD